MSRSLSSRRWLAVALVLLGGCHARFRQAAPHLGAVRTQIVSTSSPSVVFGVGGEDFLFLDEMLEADQTGRVSQRLDRSVDVTAMNTAFEEQLAQTLEDGPPFGLTEKKRAPLLQVEVEDYGMIVPELGQQGLFFYDLAVRIYDRDGKRVYKTGLTCTTPAGDPMAISVALGTVDNARQVEDMRKREIQAAFGAAARDCANELVMRMRKHAGPGIGEDLERAWDEVEDHLTPDQRERARDGADEARDRVEDGVDEELGPYLRGAP